MTNVITFPKDNKRLDVSTTPITAEDVAKEIEKIKMDFYHEVADELIDSMVRKISSLNLGEDDIILQDIDIIFLRETITAFICKLGSIPHPLSNLSTIVIKDLNIRDGMIDYRLGEVALAEKAVTPVE